MKPPAQLKAAIMEQVRDRVAAKKSAAAKPATTPSRFMPIVWGIAASLAIACFWLWNERAQLAQQVISMTEVEAEAREQLITVRDDELRLVDVERHRVDDLPGSSPGQLRDPVALS